MDQKYMSLSLVVLDRRQWATAFLLCGLHAQVGGCMDGSEIHEPLIGIHERTLTGDCVSVPQHLQAGGYTDHAKRPFVIGSYGPTLTDDCICCVPVDVLRSAFPVRGYSPSLRRRRAKAKGEGDTGTLPTQICNHSAKATPSRRNTEKAFNAMPSQNHPVNEQNIPKKHI
jgi:hypothetical protein